MDADRSPSDRSAQLPARTRAVGCLLLATLCWSLLAPRLRMGEGVQSTNLEQYLGRETHASALAQDPAWRLSYRMFAALAHVNLALRGAWHPLGELAQVDEILDDTLRLERAWGKPYFLLAHGKPAALVAASQTSAFVDGAISLMIAARQLAARELALHAHWQDPGYALEHPDGPAPREELTQELRVRLASLAQRMEENALLCVESYPDTCETLSMVIVLSAMRMLDKLDHTRAHEPLIARWLKVARRKLIDPQTGLLITRFSPHGARRRGPEGSSLWLVAHCLQLLDPAFARDQYRRAKRALSSSAFGLGFAREWPRGQAGDRDSFAYLPWREAGARASAFAVLGAKAFADERQLRDLLSVMGLFARPVKTSEQARHASTSYALHLEAAGPLGNVLLLYAIAQGPLWRTVRGRAP